MAAHDEVPSAADIFLKKKSGARRRAGRSTGALDLFAGVEAAKPGVAPVAGNAAPQALTGAAGTTTRPAPQPDSARVWTVGDLVREVRALVEGHYARVAVEGEISNWRPAASGHRYFTLKDGAAQLSVVMFRREAALVRFKAKDGDAVRLRGQVSVYEQRGQMQLIAESMELAGIGAQLAAVQELKARLKREGLFDHKRRLPAFPRCIGVVTSLQGAALRDLVKVCKRRHAAVNLVVYPAVVQGPRCAAEVAAGLRWFSVHANGKDSGRVDVVIVARGGGSWEDLHGFDDERVARAIAGCAVPVITGIGHATDSTIADAAADVCAPTPSAAGELVTAAQHRVDERVTRLRERVARAGGYELLRWRQRLSRLSAEPTLRRLRDGLRQRAQRIDELELRLQAASARAIKTRTERLARWEARLRRQDVHRRLAESRRRLEWLCAKLERAGMTTAEARRVYLEHVWARAEAMNPLRVLERGYALVYGPNGKLLRAAAEVDEGENIIARLGHGAVRATVLSVED